MSFSDKTVMDHTSKTNNTSNIW